MVTICTKKFATAREKLLSDRRNSSGTREANVFLKRLKEQRSRGSSSRILSGTSVPNSVFKSIHASIDNDDRQSKSSLSAKERFDYNESSNSTNSLKFSLNTSNQSNDKGSIVSTQFDENRRSILSGTGTLEELLELKDLLHKSSYIPKQTRTRRPTIEKIKSAIEKEKQTLVDKSENTINAEQSDASTSTIKRKKTAKPSKSKARLTSNVSTRVALEAITKQSAPERKKGTFKKKLSNKIDVEIQCSIFKTRK